MKALVVYDTNYGNTKSIAEALAKKLGKEVKAVSIQDVKKKELSGLDLLIVGSPVIGSNPTEKMSAFLSGLAADQLQGVKAASFDTRMKPFFFTNAVNKISRGLKKAGAQVTAEPQKFWVKGAEGPLLDGELERAAEWAAAVKAEYLK